MRGWGRASKRARKRLTGRRAPVVALGVIGLICAGWSVVAAVLIARDVRSRGVRVSFLWLRLMILKYLYEYARLTREETGRVGPLFYHYVVPLNVALVIAVVFAVSQWA
jgi:hypothetical protein